jgi:predicted patatin/cPLA2 family phospholipase
MNMNHTILGLNGGGMRGALQLGALHEIAAEKGETQLYKVFHEGIYGISIGAIMGALLAFKFSTDELNQLIDYFVNIQDSIQPLRLQAFIGFGATNGLDDGTLVFKTLSEIFAKKSLDLKTLKVGDAAIPLYIIASDVTNLKIVRFGPQMRVWDAIRASMSLPFIFTPHTIGETLFVDGAVLCTNIMTAIPREDRHKCLLLTTTYSPRITPQNYVAMLPFCRPIMETHITEREYPLNTCLLVEDSTQMFSFWDNRGAIEKLLAVGRHMYLLFRTKCRLQEAAHDADGSGT